MGSRSGGPARDVQMRRCICRRRSTRRCRTVMGLFPNSLMMRYTKAKPPATDIWRRMPRTEPPDRQARISTGSAFSTGAVPGTTTIGSVLPPSGLFGQVCTTRTCTTGPVTVAPIGSIRRRVHR